MYVLIWKKYWGQPLFFLSYNSAYLYLFTSKYRKEIEEVLIFSWFQFTNILRPSYSAANFSALNLSIRHSIYQSSIISFAYPHTPSQACPPRQFSIYPSIMFLPIPSVLLDPFLTHLFAFGLLNPSCRNNQSTHLSISYPAIPGSVWLLANYWPSHLLPRPQQSSLFHLPPPR